MGSAVIGRPFFLWALLLVMGAALWSGQARALVGTDVTVRQLLGESYEGLMQRQGVTVTGTPSGVRVGAHFEPEFRTSLGRLKKFPMAAAATIPKSAITPKAAALCVALPAKCVGNLALGLAAGWAFNEAANAILATEPRYQTSSPGNCQFNNTSSGQFTGPNPASREGCFAALMAEVERRASLVAASQGGPWQVQLVGPRYRSGGGAYDPVAAAVTYCQSYRHVRTTGTGAGTPTTLHECGMTFRGVGLGTPATRPVTASEIDQSFAASAANWQDTTFAAVFADAVAKGAKYPITTFDGAEMAPEAQAVEDVASGTTTRNGQTVTSTTTATLAATVTGTTVGDTEARVTERVVVVTTGPDGTTVEETETAPELEGGVETPTEVEPPTVNVEFPPVEFQDTPLPAVPDLYEQKYPDGFAGVWATRSAQLSQTPFIQGVTSMFSGFGSTGTCPVFQMPLNFGVVDFGIADLSPPCWLWDVLALVLMTTAVFVARRIIVGG